LNFASFEKALDFLPLPPNIILSSYIFEKRILRNLSLFMTILFMGIVKSRSMLKIVRQLLKLKNTKINNAISWSAAITFENCIKFCYFNIGEFKCCLQFSEKILKFDQVSTKSRFLILIGAKIAYSFCVWLFAETQELCLFLQKALFLNVFKQAKR
jgi:hypothetical protein